MVLNKINNKLKLGIVASGSRIWLGGVCYTELLLKAIRTLQKDLQPLVTLIFREEVLADPESMKLFHEMIPLADSLAFVYPHELKIEGSTQQPVRIVKDIVELKDSVDFIFPAHARVIEDIPNATWWPDFQHKYLPEFFQEHDIADRNEALKDIEARAKCVIFSSQDALNDFQRFHPNHHGAVAVLPFFALPEEAVFQANPKDTVSKYNLPQDFFLCCNQFWIHKNHKLIFQALAELKNKGIERHVVFTGQTFDARHPDYYPELQKLRSELGLEEITHILGVIPRNDQQQLIRATAAIIQPSLFEGWSTVVEDSRALGKSILLSDLSVHFEQAPRYAIYFNRKDPISLARLIGDFDMSFAHSQRAVREQIAKKQAYELANNLGRSLISLAEQIIPLWLNTGQSSYNSSQGIAALR